MMFELRHYEMLHRSWPWVTYLIDQLLDKMLGVSADQVFAVDYDPETARMAVFHYGEEGPRVDDDGELRRFVTLFWS